MIRVLGGEVSAGADGGVVVQLPASLPEGASFDVFTARRDGFHRVGHGSQDRIHLGQGQTCVRYLRAIRGFERVG